MKELRFINKNNHGEQLTIFTGETFERNFPLFSTTMITPYNQYEEVLDVPVITVPIPNGGEITIARFDEKESAIIKEALEMYFGIDTKEDSLEAPNLNAIRLLSTWEQKAHTTMELIFKNSIYVPLEKLNAEIPYSTPPYYTGFNNNFDLAATLIGPLSDISFVFYSSKENKLPVFECYYLSSRLACKWVYDEDDGYIIDVWDSNLMTIILSLCKTNLSIFLTEIQMFFRNIENRLINTIVNNAIKPIKAFNKNSMLFN